MTLRVAVADDHALFRQGLISLLQLQPEVEVVAEIARAGDLDAAISEIRCDVVLLDLRMERSTLDDIERLAARVTVVVLTASESADDAVAAVRLGARAVVHKRFAIETLMDALRAATEGHVWLPPSVQAVMTRDWSSLRPHLTSREKEIVKLVALGLRNAEIATRLFISEATVKTHVNNVFQKIGVRDRVELTLYAVRVGLATVTREPS